MSILGVAFHNLDELDLAVDAFRYALLENEKDGNTWMNLGIACSICGKLTIQFGLMKMRCLCTIFLRFSPLLRSRSWFVIGEIEKI